MFLFFENKSFVGKVWIKGILIGEKMLGLVFVCEGVRMMG
jgi:hypothetical protein